MSFFLRGVLARRSSHLVRHGSYLFRLVKQMEKPPPKKKEHDGHMLAYLAISTA